MGRARKTPGKALRQKRPTSRVVRDSEQRDAIDTASRRRPEQLTFEPVAPADRGNGLGEYLECFDARTQEIMEARFVEGLGLQDIATRLGYSRHEVEQRLTDALTHLRETLTDDSQNDSHHNERD